MDESKGQAGGVLTPVAWAVYLKDGYGDVPDQIYTIEENARDLAFKNEGARIEPLFTRPTPAAAARLTDEQITQLVEHADGSEFSDHEFARAVEAAVLAASPAAAAGVPTVLNALDVLARMGLAQDTAPAATFLQIMGERDLFVIDMRGASPVAPAGAPAEERECLREVMEADKAYNIAQGTDDGATRYAAIKRLSAAHARARALLSAGSQGEQHDSSHEAAPQSSVASPAPRSSLPASDDSALPPAPPIYCPEKAKPGGCQLHNLQCGWPACNKRPRKGQE